jgi:hypothetical protein
MKQQMRKFDVAMQQAIAAELKSRIYRENRNQTWLQKESGVKPTPWRYYFGSNRSLPDRNVPLDVVRRLAEAAGMTTGELVTIAERNAPNYLLELVKGMKSDEADELLSAIDRTRNPRPLPTSKERNARRSAIGE